MSEFLDARAEEMPQELRAAVCIVGAGAAGITMALRLSKTVKDVLLIEAGGLDIDGITQSLYNGRQLGLPYFNLTACRLRYFGGTTNHWGGYCRANDPVDYEGRPELNLPKWPVGADELAPYISEAGEMIGVEDSHFDPRASVEARGMPAGQMAEDVSDVLQTKVFLLARKKRFAKEFRADLESMDNLRVVYNLNATHIQLNEAGNAVDHLVTRTLDGKEIAVRAAKFVLCCHGIENARLMMASDDVQPRGVGNDTDHVGRYFMDHIHIHASRMVPTSNFPRMYDYRSALKAQLNANISFTDAFTREAGLLQYYCRFRPVFVSEEANDALLNLYTNSMQAGDLQYLRDIGVALSEFGGTVRKTLKAADVMFFHPDYYELEHRLEQAPNPNSRVVLSDRRDELGSRVADLDWQILDIDVDSFRRGQDEIAKEVSAANWGRVEKEEITRSLVEERVAGHYHHIGTTRMSETAREGVVDSNCRVFGVDNLYVGGSSVFPTAGYSGPTMMLIALAMRLSDHLSETA